MSVMDCYSYFMAKQNCPDSKVYGANMGPPGADMTQLGPMLVPWTLLSGCTDDNNLNNENNETYHSSWW